MKNVGNDMKKRKVERLKNVLDLLFDNYQFSMLEFEDLSSDSSDSELSVNYVKQEVGKIKRMLDAFSGKLTPKNSTEK